MDLANMLNCSLSRIGKFFIHSRVPRTMGNRLELERQDGRNLVVVTVIMTLIMIVMINEPLFVRVVSATIAGIITAISFLVVTVAIRVFGPDHW